MLVFMRMLQLPPPPPPLPPLILFLHLLQQQRHQHPTRFLCVISLHGKFLFVLTVN